MSAWLVTNSVVAVLLPPGLLILLALAGLSIIRAAPRTGRALALCSLVALYILATPIVGSSLLRWLEPPYADPTADPRPGAIVILGGGTYRGAPEYGENTVSWFTLERVRYGVLLHSRTKKPILVSGTTAPGARTSEAAQMVAVLREFGATATWVEDRSRNTFENARFSYEALTKNGIDTIYLVTHAWHMRRARMAFERVGFTVIAAPTVFRPSGGELTALDFLPNAAALMNSFEFFHEVVGIVWYRLKFALAK